MNKSLKQKVKNAYEEMVQQRTFDLPTEETVKGGMRLTDDFGERLEERVKKDKRCVIIWGKQVSKAAVIILFSLITSFTVYAVIESRFLYRVFEKNTVIRTIEEEMQNGEEELNQIYLPTYVMDFYEVDTMYTNTSLAVVYSNEKGEAFTFIQRVIQTELLFDNEYTEEEIVSVHGVEAIRFLKRGETILIWCEYGYMYVLDVPEKYGEDVIKIAESLEVNN